MQPDRLLKIAIVNLILISAGFGFTGFPRARGEGSAHEGGAASGVVVRKEAGPQGHATIGIDESALRDPGREHELTFAALMQWKYQIDDRLAPPEPIKALNHRKVRLTGFMYPLQQGQALQYFCLLRTTQTCCYGPRPQYNQYVLVEMGQPTAFHRLDPVTCMGRFYVEPTPEEGFIYRMEGTSCGPANRR